MEQGNSREQTQRSSATGVPDPPLPFSGGRIPADEVEWQQVERRVMALYFVAPALSFALLVTGFSLGWQRLSAAGVAGLAGTALAVGGLAVRERRLLYIRGGSMTQRAYRYFIYEGLAAVPYGLAMVVVGATAMVAVLLFLAGTSFEEMRAAAWTRPHRILLPGGAALLCQGLGFLIGFRRATTSFGDWLAVSLLDLPARLAGLILAAIGSLAAILGLLEWLRPQPFPDLLRLLLAVL